MAADSLKLGQSLLAGLALTLASCGEQKPGGSDIQSQAPSVSELVPIQFATWDGAGIESIKPVPAKASLNPENMMALSACNCAPGLTAKYFTLSAISQGVLPQVLVPSVRNKIATNSTLSLLNSLPSGLASLMRGLFATDDTIYTSVRDGIQDMLSRSLQANGGTNISLRLPFRLDLFTTTVIAPAGYPVAFKIKDQAARWNMVFNTNAMWKNAIPVDGTDHGLQLLETMRVIAEWAYMAGIGGNGSPDGFGGLASSVQEPAGTMAKPENPETAAESWAIYGSGTYTVGYPYASSIDLATRIKERWTLTVDGVSLEEQAMIWRAGALAFAKMREDRLAEAKSLFSDPDGALTQSMAQLPLLWLPAMGHLLKENYLDEKTLEVQEYAYPNEGQQRRASLRSLIRTAQALQEWRLATTDISSLNLADSLKKRLSPLPDDLIEPLQLVARSVLNQHTAVVTEGGLNWIVATQSNGSIETDAALIAETVATLGVLDQSLFRSPDLKERLTSLYHWHVKTNLMAPLAKGEEIPVTTLLWNIRAAEVMKNYQESAPWIQVLQTQLQSAVVGISL